MKTQQQVTDAANRQMIANTLDYLHESLMTIKAEIELEYTYGIAPTTGTLTKASLNRLKELEQQKRDTERSCRLVERQLDGFIPSRMVPTNAPDTDEIEFDLIRVLDQAERETEEYLKEKALAEIQAARERGTSLDQEIER